MTSPKGGVSLPRYAAGRLLQALPLILGVIFLTFVILQFAPGDAARIQAGDLATPEYVEQLRHELGLDRPVYEQLLIYVQRLAQGNLGYSFVARLPVLDLILSRLPATILLMISATTISTLFGIILGVSSSKRPYSALDNIVSLTSSVGFAMPVFWLGQMLILLFSLYLGVLPVQGMTDPRMLAGGLEYVADIARHLILPSISLASFYLAIVTRLTRASMLEILHLDFITTAYSKGLRENAVIYKHALRNALLPVTTIVALNMGFMFAGSTLVEIVFAWPGVGRLMYTSIFARDIPIIAGLFIVISIVVILINLVTDVLYSVLDPRIRYR